MRNQQSRSRGAVGSLLPDNTILAYAHQEGIMKVVVSRDGEAGLDGETMPAVVGITIMTLGTGDEPCACPFCAKCFTYDLDDGQVVDLAQEALLHDERDYFGEALKALSRLDDSYFDDDNDPMYRSMTDQAMPEEMTDRQAEAWIAEQQEQYRKGLLPKWKEDRIRRMPGDILADITPDAEQDSDDLGRALAEADGFV